MLSSSYPQLDASVANLGILASADEQAIERFKAAYTQYAKALGTNSARPVAISHLVGESGAIQAFTLHIRLAGVDQSLLALLILQEASLAFGSAEELAEMVEDVYLPQLPPAEFPYLHESAAALVEANYNPADEFGFGLDLVLAALEPLRCSGSGSGSGTGTG